MGHMKNYIVGFSKSFENPTIQQGLRWILENGSSNLHKYDDPGFVEFFDKKGPLFLKYDEFFEEFIKENPKYGVTFKVYPHSVDILYGTEMDSFRDWGLNRLHKSYWNQETLSYESKTTKKEDFFAFLKKAEDTLSSRMKSKIIRPLEKLEQQHLLTLSRFRGTKDFERLQMCIQNVSVHLDLMIETH